MRVSSVCCNALRCWLRSWFRFGIRYDDFWGIEGVSHSLVFAALLSVVAVLILSRRRTGSLGAVCPIRGYLFLATASHGVLDAMTDGGLSDADLCWER